MALASASGCARLRPLLLGEVASGNAFTEEDLREALGEYDGRFAAIVASTASDISENASERRVRRRSLLWRLRMVPLMREAAFDDDPQEAYVGALTVATTMRIYFAEGDGKDLFEEQQAKAVEVSRVLEDDAVTIGARFLTPAQLEQLRARVAELAAKNPIRGREFATENVRVGLARVGETVSLQWIFDLPMLPYRTLEGISSTAVAVHEFNQTAQEFAEIIADLPRQNRWQMELFLYDVEDRETIVKGLAAFEQLTASADRASAAVDRLPRELRGAAGDVGPIVRELNEATVRARDLAKLLGPVLADARAASDAWAGIFAPTPGAEPGRPFDVREWESAAGRLGGTAGELRGLAVELRALLDSPRWAALGTEMASPVAQARRDATALVDLVAWRAVQVIAFFFGCLLVYRLAAGFAGRRSGPSP